MKVIRRATRLLASLKHLKVTREKMKNQLVLLIHTRWTPPE
jgi:hypothetical protein